MKKFGWLVLALALATVGCGHTYVVGGIPIGTPAVHITHNIPVYGTTTVITNNTPYNFLVLKNGGPIAQDLGPQGTITDYTYPFGNYVTITFTVIATAPDGTPAGVGAFVVSASGYSATSYPWIVGIHDLRK